MSPKILVVEDNPMNLELVREVLMAGGMEVIEARNGQEGLRMAAEDHPALILLDIRLPGMDGYAVLRQLKSNPKTAFIPVAALTAQAMVGDKEQTLAAGFDHYIAKPIDTRTLAGEVRQLLERHRRAAS
jgi:two-component system, cell cycle response regulator DivK